MLYLLLDILIFVLQIIRKPNHFHKFKFRKKRIITIIILAISIHVSCNFQEEFIILKAAFAVFVHVGKRYIKIQNDVQLFPSRVTYFYNSIFQNSLKLKIISSRIKPLDHWIELLKYIFN